MRAPRTLAALAAALTLAVVAAGCGSDSSSGSSDTTGTASSGAKTKVGFIYVGPKDDFGYNQAAYEGSEAAASTLGNVELLQAESVPEDAGVERVMERMISQGAKVLFPTSYGYLKYAQEVAAKHPDVMIVHQGGLEADPKLPNFGTYFGTVYEPVYLAGIAAGKATKTNKLGYIVAFPIPQTLANVNAFELGAKSVNPKATTTVVFTASWCDPGKQAQAATALINQDVDVLTQHQDCTKTIIETAERAGKYSVGYHYDASSLAPKGWLTGSEWNWGPMYTDIIKTAESGSFTGSKYDGDYRVGLQTGDNPFVQSKFGPAVDADTQAAIATAKEGLATKGIFTGPLKDQSGKEVVPAGKTLSYAEVEQMNFLVEGVVGNIPK
ncbi:MAG: BMP family ABC transporter substrate-binding protein [Thermoleophilia bacterium]